MGVLNFNTSSFASNYDDVLVPIMFEPWAINLIERYADWDGKTVLDIAAGTGIVTRLLAEKVGKNGCILAADINPAMLQIAEKRCENIDTNISFIVSPAHPLDVSDASVDVITCQQGFQFFPDKPAAASEMHRVLRNGGRVMASIWRPVDECDLFSVLCEALTSVDESGLAGALRAPSDLLSASDLSAMFEAAGFESVAIEQHSMDLVVDGGIEHAIEVVYATPIAPQLQEFTDEKRKAFQEELATRFTALGNGGTTLGKLASSILVAEKAI